MRRYSASLLVQKEGFHQLVAEFNKGGGIPRASLAQEVAVVVADAMAAFSQVCQSSTAPRSCCGLESGVLSVAETLPINNISMLGFTRRVNCSHSWSWADLYFAQRSLKL